MAISVIIPTYHEANTIGKLLQFLTSHHQQALYEVIVVDGGSQDATCSIVEEYTGVKLLKSPVASRPAQMNLGAKHACHEVLYFVHADVQLPDSFVDDIVQHVQHYPAGVYKYKFDSPSWLLRINAFFTRFPMMWCRGGDQTLYITRTLFDALHGFDEYFCVLEDFVFLPE